MKFVLGREVTSLPALVSVMYCEVYANAYATQTMLLSLP
jgi:hypothetical protein